jgi:chromosome segregation ATPase
VAIILGVAITLGLLGAINGGLRYSRPADLSAVESEFQMLQAEASTLSDEVEALRQRMDNLEALSGRVSQVEEITGNLQAELEATGQELETANQQLAALSGEMETLSGEIQSLKAEVAALQDSTTRFEDFLGGLGQLLRRVGIPLPGGETAPGGDNP